MPNSALLKYHVEGSHWGAPPPRMQSTLHLLKPHEPLSPYHFDVTQHTQRWTWNKAELGAREHPLLDKLFAPAHPLFGSSENIQLPNDIPFFPLHKRTMDATQLRQLPKCARQVVREAEKSGALDRGEFTMGEARRAVCARLGISSEVAKEEDVKSAVKEAINDALVSSYLQTYHSPDFGRGRGK